ncbi:MAG: PilW family protein [Pseudomonadota bacterium]
MKHQRGFTLVEIMVAMAIGLVMTAVIVTVFGQSTQSSKVNQARGEIQEQARVALDTLQRDLRQAGYIGCNSNRLLNSGGLINTATTPASYLDNIAISMQGYEGTGASFVPAAPVAVTGATPNASPINDAITIRIPAGQPVSLSGTMASGTAVVPVFSTAGFAAATRAVIGDCAQSSLFVVTGVAGGLQHAVGASNTTADLGRAFGPDAMVVAFNTISYYVAPSSFSGENSLWRRVGLAGNSEEVAEGVEDFQLTYGQDTDGDNFADIFTAADAVADWRQVVSVRASLLLRSKADRTAQNAQAYNFNGATSIAPPDRRLRRPFNITVQLRNRTI